MGAIGSSGMSVTQMITLFLHSTSHMFISPGCAFSLQGHLEAQVTIAHYYDKGIGVEEFGDDAAEWSVGVSSTISTGFMAPTRLIVVIFKKHNHFAFCHVFSGIAKRRNRATPRPVS